MLAYWMSILIHSFKEYSIINYMLEIISEVIEIVAEVIKVNKESRFLLT
jgi:hypothetical protein